MKRNPVLIVGAGPTGLVLAIALVKCGIIPRIIDKKAGVTRESRALGVQARTLELYRQLGIAETIVGSGVQVQNIFMRKDGRTVANVNVKDFGIGLSPFPFILCLPQDVHEKILVDHLESLGVRVEWERELVQVHDAQTHVIATLCRKDGLREECVADYVVGCDGGRSRVREELNLGFPGATSQKTYFVADVEATGEIKAREMALNAFSFCLSAGDFILVLPARASGSHRLIGLIPEELTSASPITFEQLRPMVAKATAVNIDRVNWFSTYRVHHRVANHFRRGRVFVAGDAGHIHSPLGGQGMNTGIGDAINLAWKLAAAVGQRNDSSILDTYEAERLPFARLLVSTTDRLFQLISGPGFGRRIARTILFLHVIPRLLRYSPTRRIVFRRISQAHVHYRASRLSEGTTGALKGGDRLPWVALEGGADNFGPLQSFDWQIHVYGRADDRLREAASVAGVPLHEFEWTDRMAQARFRRDACYLVRPDGYIAKADPGQNAPSLAASLTSFGARLRRPASLVE